MQLRHAGAIVSRIQSEWNRRPDRPRSSASRRCAPLRAVETATSRGGSGAGTAVRADRAGPWRRSSPRARVGRQRGPRADAGAAAVSGHPPGGAARADCRPRTRSRGRRRCDSAAEAVRCRGRDPPPRRRGRPPRPFPANPPPPARRPAGRPGADDVVVAGDVAPGSPPGRPEAPASAAVTAPTGSPGRSTRGRLLRRVRARRGGRDPTSHPRQREQHRARRERVVGRARAGQRVARRDPRFRPSASCRVEQRGRCGASAVRGSARLGGRRDAGAGGPGPDAGEHSSRGARSAPRFQRISGLSGLAVGTEGHARLGHRRDADGGDRRLVGRASTHPRTTARAQAVGVAGGGRRSTWSSAGRRRRLHERRLSSCSCCPRRCPGVWSRSQFVTIAQHRQFCSDIDNSPGDDWMGACVTAEPTPRRDELERILVAEGYLSSADWRSASASRR